MALNFHQDLAQGDELKRQLMQSVESQQAVFLKQAEQFYSQDLRTRENYVEFAEAIVKSVDDILSQGNWDDSLFARNCLRPLRDIRDQAEKIIQAEKSSSTLKRPNFIAGNKKTAYQKVYIALFQSKGFELKQWELQLRSIESHLVGRPVYRKEEEVKAAIRLKNAPDQEAYIEVDVDEKKIHSDLTREDRFGHSLVSLAHDAVNPAHIRAFIHAGKRYDFYDGKLKEKREE
jgi:intracellular multiplication protein IcmQ